MVNNQPVRFALTEAARNAVHSYLSNVGDIASRNVIIDSLMDEGDLRGDIMSRHIHRTSTGGKEPNQNDLRYNGEGHKTLHLSEGDPGVESILDIVPYKNKPGNWVRLRYRTESQPLGTVGASTFSAHMEPDETNLMLNDMHQDGIIQHIQDRNTAQQYGRKLPDWVPQETDNNPDTGWMSVASSWIGGLKYKPGEGTRMMVKKGGKEYPYPGINLSMFRRWVSSQSKGKWWWRNIGHPGQDIAPKRKKSRQIQASKWTGAVHPLFQPNQNPDKLIAGDRTSARLIDEALGRMSLHTGRTVTRDELAALVGALPGTLTFAHKDPGNGEFSFNTSDVRTDYETARELLVPANRQNPMRLENSVMIINNKPNIYRGASGPVYLRQMRAAYDLGIPKVTYTAAWDPHGRYLGGEDFTGGLHWPMIGGDGILPEDYVRRLPYHVRDAADAASGGLFSQTRQISHMFMSPLAKEHYIDNPTTHSGFLDTTPGSYSRKNIEHHVAKNAARYGYEQPTPDESMSKMPITFSKHRYTHPKLIHLLATGELHPDYFDSYFEN